MMLAVGWCSIHRNDHRTAKIHGVLSFLPIREYFSKVTAVFILIESLNGNGAVHKLCP
jgi:hypothetical protein